MSAAQIVLWIVAVAALVVAVVTIVMLLVRKPSNGQPGPTGPQGENGKPGRSEPPPSQSMLLVYENYLDEEGKDPQGARIVPQRSVPVDNTGPYFATGDLTAKNDAGWWVQTQTLECKESGKYLFTGAVFVAFPQAPGPGKDKYAVAVRWTPSGTRKGEPVFDTILYFQQQNVGHLQTVPLDAFTVDMAAGDLLYFDLYAIIATSSWNVGAAIQLDILPGA
jgi:hypothetical protein